MLVIYQFLFFFLIKKTFLKLHTYFNERNALQTNNKKKNCICSEIVIYTSLLLNNLRREKEREIEKKIYIYTLLYINNRSLYL